MESQGHSCAEGNPSFLDPGKMGTIERRRDLPNPRTIASHPRRARWGVRRGGERGQFDSKNRSIGSQKKSASERASVDGIPHWRRRDPSRA